MARKDLAEDDTVELQDEHVETLRLDDEPDLVVIQAADARPRLP